MKRSFARTWNAVKSEIFPYVFAMLQLIMLIFGVMPFANSPLITAGRTNHALKVIMTSHLWILIFSVTLFVLFYRVRREGIEEKSATVISLLATMFSAFNLAVYLVDNLLLLMWATENVAIALYLMVPIMGVYKILNVFLLPRIKWSRKSKQH